MAKQPVITDITSLADAITPINDNFDNVQTAFDNTLSRDGSTPNQMEADIDMNSNDILNAKDVSVSGTLLVGGVPITGGSLPVSASFSTRALFETAVTDGLSLPDGSIVAAGNFLYAADSSASYLPNLSGWVPQGAVFLEHYGIETTTKGNGSAPDWTTEVQAAMTNTVGNLIFTGWVKVSDKIVCSNLCRPVVPMGRANGGFGIFTDFNMAATCVLQPGTAEPGATVGDFGMWFEQDTSVTVRANLNQYPPAFDISSTPRVKLESVRLEGGWDGIIGDGNCGGARFGTLELGCFNTNMRINGALDFVHADSIAVWLFGYAGSTNLANIFYDGDTVGLELNKVDNWSCDKMSVFRAKVILNDTNGDNALPFQFGSMSLDGDDARLFLQEGRSQISRLYSTKTAGAPGTEHDVHASAGFHQIGMATMTSSADAAILTSGDARLHVGDWDIFHQNNGRRAGIAQGTSVLSIGNFAPRWTDTARTNELLNQQTGAALKVHNISIRESYSNSEELIVYDTDDERNLLNGRGLGEHTASFSVNWSLGDYRTDELTMTVGEGEVQQSLRTISSTVNGAEYRMERARGSVGSEAAVQDGDLLGDVAWRSYDGTGWRDTALIRAIADGTVSAGVLPSRLDFIVTDSAGSTGTPMRVEAGGISVGTQATGNITTGNAYIAMGDSDTGFRQSADGTLDVICNNTVRATFSPTEAYLRQNIRTDNNLSVAGNISSTSDTSNTVIFGGTNGNGANIELYGASHATTPREAVYDADRHRIRPAAGGGEIIDIVTTGSPSMTMNGDFEVTGDITGGIDVTGASTFDNNVSITGTISSGGNTDFTHIYGGSSGDGAEVRVYGGSHAAFPDEFMTFADRQRIRSADGAVTMMDIDTTSVDITGNLRVSGNIANTVTNSSNVFYGGTSGNGAHLALYGSTAGLANQSILDTDRHRIRSADGLSTFVEVDSTSFDITGNLEVSGDIVGDSDTGTTVIFGGTQGDGANIELYGGSHATSADTVNIDADRAFFRKADGTGTLVDLDPINATPKMILNGQLVLGDFGTEGGEILLQNAAGGVGGYIDIDASGNFRLRDASGAFLTYNGSNLSSTVPVRKPVYAVAGLPSASPSGQTAFVNDANATTFHSIVVGGGSNFVPVFSDGTNWRIG